MEARQQWLKDRQKGIGGSDAPAILGISPWKTPLQVYLEKRGEAPGQEDNPSMRWGRNLEPVVRQAYADETGRRVAIPAVGILRHPRHDWMLASLDGIAEGDRVLEVKTARVAAGWGEPGTDEIPEPYQAQVQHYMAVTGFYVADVAVLIGGSDFRIYEVPADPELQELIIDQEAAFWDRVQHGVEPDPVSAADIKIKFGRHSVARQVQASPEVLAALRQLEDIKALKAEEEGARAVIQAHMGEADTLVDGEKVLATWKAGKPSKRFDATAFKAAHPELHTQFIKEGEPSRRFLIK